MQETCSEIGILDAFAFVLRAILESMQNFLLQFSIWGQIFWFLSEIFQILTKS